MKLTKRETATVLAALRYWQREGWISSGHEHEIASDGNTLEPLSDSEIDALCERINCDEDALEPQAYTLDGQPLEDFEYLNTLSDQDKILVLHMNVGDEIVFAPRRTLQRVK